MMEVKCRLVVSPTGFWNSDEVGTRTEILPSLRVARFHKLFLCALALAVGILADTRVHAQAGGVPLWTNRYNSANDEATAVAVDGSGNVFVTGWSRSGNSYDWATVAYSGAGVPLWTNCHALGIAGAITVDGSGSVFVAGEAYATIKYSSAGVPLWTNRYDYGVATALAVDARGNVFVTGESRGDYETIAHSGAGTPLWTNRYSGLGNHTDRATAVAVDADGNVFVTGYSPNTNVYPYDYDYATIAYSGAGVPLWTNRYNPPGNRDDYAIAVVVDAQGNVFVTGTAGVGGDPDYATIKYSGAGVPLWTNRCHVTGSEYVCAVAVDGSGNVVVTGSSYGANGNAGYATIKYSNTGVPLWTSCYNGPGNRENIARAMAVDGSGNVLVTGYSLDGDGHADYATIAYSSVGVPLWTNRYSEPGYPKNRASAIAVDGSGNVFVTGTSESSGTDYDYVTIKYLSVSRPLLTIARTTTNTVAVSWPSPATDFTLQQSINAASTNWTPVGTTPADDGTNKTVIVDTPEGSRFYRLAHP